MNKNKIKFWKRAESLMETIIAVTVIALGATAAGVMVRTSMYGNEMSQQRMAAINFAREGIEAVRSIRDTNWLRYGGSCWNSLEGTDATDCAVSRIANETYYAIKLDMDSLAYYLEDVPADSDVFEDDYQLYECGITNPVTDGSGAIYGIPSDDAGCVPSDFYRNVYIDYDTVPGATYMTVTVTVGWIGEGEEKTVELEEIIGNF
ncbi:MAG: hypothetical protein WCT46_02635 [Candidatus Gracilibacteria bacterium]